MLISLTLLLATLSSLFRSRAAIELGSLDAISELPSEYPGWMVYKAINRSNVLERDAEARRAYGYS